MKKADKPDLVKSEEKMLKKRFYDQRICPDCLKMRKGFVQEAREGLNITIKCGNCGAEFNITPQTRLIERIRVGSKQ